MIHETDPNVQRVLLKEAQRRFMEIMNRHIRADDNRFSDDGLVKAAMARYHHERGQPIIDVSE